MKKIVFLIVFLMMSIYFAVAAVEGNTYFDDTYNFKIEAASEQWKIDASNSKKRVVIRHEDTVSEVEVDVLLMTADQRNAKDVATFQIDTYDGWQYHGSRVAQKNEISRAKAADGYVGMYSKKILATEGGVKTIIVAEKYFIKDRKAYIVSVATDNLHWEQRKSELLKIINSFTLL